MSYLEGLRAPHGAKNVWTKIDKVIDPLHVKNHKRPECKVVYAPAKVKVKYPEANLMIAEQTFAWMGMLINENLFVLKKFQDGSRKS